MRPTKREFDRAVRKWQRRLRIEDWRLVVYFVPQRNIDDGGAMGDVELHREKRAAIVTLADPETPRASDETWEEADPGLFDWETVLVHELLHVRFAELERITPDNRRDHEWEPVIHALSMALVETERGQAA